MILAIDIGNSNIVLGVYQSDSWTHYWRLETSIHKSASDYSFDISSLFLENDLSRENIEHVVLSSVVPEVTAQFRDALESLLSQEVLVLNAKLYNHLQLKIDRPHEIGSDLVANAFAGFQLYKQSCLIVDFGTALTFTAVNAEGAIQGVSIAPGLKTAMYSLFERTAQLPEVPLMLPDSAIGKNTVHALQAGVLWGYVGLVEYMISRIKQEMDRSCKVLATGGLSEVIAPLRKQFDKVDPYLTLEGLRLIEAHARELKP